MPTTRSQARQKRTGKKTTSTSRRLDQGERGDPREAESTALMSQATRNDRVSIIRELLALFYSIDSTQIPGTMETSLNSVRTEIADDIFAVMAQAISADENLFQQMQEIWFIETSRRRVLHLLHEHGNGLTSEVTGTEVARCAAELQFVAKNLGERLYHRPTTDCFAAGVLIQILEEVVDRAAPGNSLYGHLIGNPRSLDEELCVVRCLAVGEDVLEPYYGEIQRILTKFDRMTPSLQPRSDMVQRLREKIQPAFNRSA